MSETDRAPLRICLLVDQGEVTAWQRQALERACAETAGAVTVVLNDPSERDRNWRELLERAVDLREWTLVAGLLAFTRTDAGLERTVPVSDMDCVDDARWIDCVPSTVDGWKNEVPSTVVSSVTPHADVGLRFGYGFLVGDILTALDHGVLSFHHGDIREYRGQPAGCWEFIHGRATVGVTLQRLTDRLDAGEVVAEATVDIDDARRYHEVRQRLFRASPAVLTRGLRTLDSPTADPDACEDLGDLYSFPQGRDAVRFALKELRGALG